MYVGSMCSFFSAGNAGGSINSSSARYLSGSGEMDPFHESMEEKNQTSASRSFGTMLDVISIGIRMDIMFLMFRSVQNFGN